MGPVHRPAALVRGAARAAATAAAPAAGGDRAAAVRKITATLFYVAEDGMALVPVQREVPFGATVAEQARAIVEAQLAAGGAAGVGDSGRRRRCATCSSPSAATRSSICRATSRPSIPGGSLYEIFTVYSIVNALTVNLPAITRVQILVDGKEVDTLAGHVDLRHPLSKSLEWVVHDTQ